MSDVFGHEDVLRGLAAAVRRGELPGSLLIHGPRGVGRQTVGRWLARLLVCDAPSPSGPCDSCHSCRLALDLQHPDIHWFFPLPRPKGTSGPDKLAEALEEARFEALEERRADRLHQPPADQPAGLYLAQVRTIRRLGASRPAMGDHQVFIVGDAESLVPQEGSEEAANALLKILEEPPPSTTFILTAADPEALLPTLRSRLLPVRLRPFSRDRLRQFLVEHAEVEEPGAELLARLGEGSIGRALSFLGTDDEPSRVRELRLKARGWLEAALDPDPVRRYAAAHGQRPAAARGEFSDALAFLSLWLRDLAAVAAGAEDDVVGVDALNGLRALAQRVQAERLPEAIQLVDQADEAGRINANPQLTLACLLNQVAAVLRQPGEPAGTH